MESLKVIARIRNDYESKFGVPRQSGLAEAVVSVIVFEPAYRAAEALRGIEEFTHLWLLWGFDRNDGAGWKPTVRPPRLGGNQRVGVFATRSPFRPNSIGLSCVRLLGVEKTGEGSVLKVAGADLVNGTPIYDLKPYIPYADCRPDASGGFTDRAEKRRVRVEIPPELRRAPARLLAGLEAALAEDPRPAYQEDPERVYAFEFGGWHVAFRVAEGILRVTELRPKGTIKTEETEEAKNKNDGL